MPHADGLYYERHGAGDPLLLITGWTISAAVRARARALRGAIRMHHLRPPRLGALGRLHTPTLVMHGERDCLVPLAASRLLAAQIPDAELAVVPGTGHAYALEALRESLELLFGWVERRLSRPRPGEGADAAPDR